MTEPQSDDYLGRQLPWVRAKLAKLDPDYRFKWDIYFRRLEELAKGSKAFLDAGCGDNRTAKELEGPRLRVGIDVHDRAEFGTYVCGNLENLPFADQTFDLVGCRYVIEHLDEPSAVFVELHRIMPTGGRLLIQTVNRRSFLIRLSRLLGGRIRRVVSRRRYARLGDHVFPARDRFNTPSQFENPPQGFRLVSLRMTQDVDTQSRLGFWLSYLLMRTLSSDPPTRSTITAEWERV
jgi:SAM-dependent methyltransferase